MVELLQPVEKKPRVGQVVALNFIEEDQQILDLVYNSNSKVVKV